MYSPQVCHTTNGLFWKICTFLHFLVGFLLLTAKTNPTIVVGSRAMFVLGTIEYNRGQECFSMKGHIVNDFGFVDLMGSLISIQVWY